MQGKEKMVLIYELFMAALAIVVAVILFIEFTRPLTEAQQTLLTNIDLSILVIFAVDYFYRIVKARDKWQFFKSNIFDLIAIMPFDKAFRLARLARLVRLARLYRSTRLVRLFRATRLVRILALLRRSGNTATGVLKTNNLNYVISITFLIIILGACGIYVIEDSMETFGDALWWSMVTTTTVGYGDISPESAGGRVLAGLLMLVGIGFLGMITGSIATYFVDRLSNSQAKEKPSIFEEQLEYVKKKLDGIAELEKEDISAINRLIMNIWEEYQVSYNNEQTGGENDGHKV